MWTRRSGGGVSLIIHCVLAVNGSVIEGLSAWCNGCSPCSIDGRSDVAIRASGVRAAIFESAGSGLDPLGPTTFRSSAVDYWGRSRPRVGDVVDVVQLVSPPAICRRMQTASSVGTTPKCESLARIDRIDQPAGRSIVITSATTLPSGPE
jgi:hypothetical protein